MSKDNVKAVAWTLFDEIVADAAPDGRHTNLWIKDVDDRIYYGPDFDTLVKLLGVPLHLSAKTRSGVPALALDVWLSYELRRAGFDMDQVWPRPRHPRILPMSVAKLLGSAPKRLGAPLRDWIERQSSVQGVTAASASILGKNYLKQVDVIMTDWHTGPELLISTKRMDSSYGKNAANRVEESYGDAKNLRLRHPMAALGFVYGLRSDILTEEPDVAAWLIDLLQKLGREDDAYHATCLIMIEYDKSIVVPTDDGTDPEDRLAQAGLETDAAPEPLPAEPTPDIAAILAKLPPVRIVHEEIPYALKPSTFLAAMVRRLLDATPVNMHKAARARMLNAAETR